MVPEWVSTAQGAHLARRQKVDTAPERMLRKAVHAAGGRFRLHPKIAKGCTPDFILPGRRVAVFVDGCFWHGCPEHGRKTPWTGPNAELWADKMVRNAERDRASSQLAQAQLRSVSPFPSGLMTGASVASERASPSSGPRC